MSTAVLLVDTDSAALARMADALRAADYAPVLADSFEAAVAALRTGGFGFVVTAHRLGAHNGLHLVLRARAEDARAGTLVTTPAPDAVLEKEAASFGALTIVAPWEHPGDLLAALERAK